VQQALGGPVGAVLMGAVMHRCHGAAMARTRTPVTLDEELLRASKVRGARTGKSELGFDLLEQLWERNDLGEDEAMGLAAEAKDWARSRRRR
jgi:hypothetical protein